MATKLTKGTDGIYRMNTSLKAVQVWRNIPAKPVVGLVILGAGGWLALKGIGFMMGLMWWVAGAILPWVVLAGAGALFISWLSKKFSGR